MERMKGLYDYTICGELGIAAAWTENGLRLFTVGVSPLSGGPLLRTV